MASPLCFLDTETLGLPLQAPVWEFAAIRREPDGQETHYHAFFDHNDFNGAGYFTEDLPDEFRNDYHTRYDHKKALKGGERAAFVYAATAGAHIVGACPNFDTERLALLMRQYEIEPRWHYHLIDVENVVLGYLARHNKLDHTDTIDLAPPMKSDWLSHQVGVDPAQFGRHTAMGDCLWVRAQWDAVMSHA